MNITIMCLIKRFLSTLFVLCIGIGIAEAQYSVRGEVVDTTGVGEPYATVRIYASDDTTKVVAMGVTGEDGTFKQELARKGGYVLTVASVGKENVTRNFSVDNSNRNYDFGKLVVRTADNVLGEVEVVAQKPLVTAEIDRLSYDVQSDEDSKTNTILEMLRKVPMVTVDGQDNIRVNGSSDFKIYKNGRPDNTMQGNPSQVLKSIPANMVKKIEVITEPGAKYDAEGVSGILNIVMEESSRIDGVMGTLYAQYNTLNQPGGNMYLTTSINDKLTASINYSYFRMSDKNMYYGDNSYTYKETGNNETQNMEVENPGNLHYASLDLSYEIDTLNLITASFSGYYIGVDQHGQRGVQMRDSNGNLMYSYVQTFDAGQQYDYSNMSGRLDYQHLTSNKGESINFSYLLSSSNVGNDYDSRYEELVNPQFDYTRYASNSDQKFIEHTFQLDWTRPIAEKHKLDIGAKYIFRRNHSVSTTQQDDNAPIDVDFMHRTHVGAVYGEYSFTSGPWMARAGVRYEFSRMTTDYRGGDGPAVEKNLNDFVPTLSLGYKLNDKNSFKLNFSTRINRPGISYLDPTINETPTEVRYGNPDLSSSRNNSLQATYTFIHPKLTLNASAGYSFANDQITEAIYVEDGLRYRTYGNIGKMRRGWLNVYAQWMPTEKTNVSFNGGANHYDYANDDLGISNKRWTFYAFLQVSQQLPWKLRLSAYGGRNEGGVWDLYSYYRPNYYYSFGLQRSFLKDDRLTVQLFAINPFSGDYQTNESVTRYGDYTGWETGRYRGRMFQVAVSFRFGSLKASVKKTRKTITNDDVVGGGGQGGGTPSAGGGGK